MQRNEHNCNNLQTLIYTNVDGTVNQRRGSDWIENITRLIAVSSVVLSADPWMLEFLAFMSCKLLFA